MKGLRGQHTPGGIVATAVRVTCYTDASYSRARGGAWAVWLRSDGGRVVRRGRCPRYVRDSHAAELAAIYAGVYLALSTWPGQVTEILIRSDSVGALADAAAEARPSRREARARLRAKIQRLLARSGVTLSYRWVRGHQSPRTGTAAWLNDACDRMARRTRMGGR